MTDRYLQAAKRIPRGETRSFMELAAMAGRPGAARAAGRAVRLCRADSALPWHRVVAADGKLSTDSGKAALQLARLRREGARPRAGESVAAWSRRRGVGFVGKLPERVFVPAGDERGEPWAGLQVEPLEDEASALARGFRPVDGGVAPRFVRRRRRSRATAGRAVPLGRRLSSLDWSGLLGELESRGCFKVRALLSPGECERILDASERPGRFDRTVEMLGKGYGVGVYRYWKEPLPAPLRELREVLYAKLRSPADDVRAESHAGVSYPPTLGGFWKQCRAAGQRRASSILIQYPTRGINHPHRDIYGKVWFPFQALVVLSRHGRDFEGGEFVLIEEHPGGDRRREVPVGEGDLVVFGSQMRWEKRAGRRRKVPLLHAMNAVTRGQREAIGLVFHLAE